MIHLLMYIVDDTYNDTYNTINRSSFYLDPYRI